ncbi:MAG: FAD:protein FMN transferase [Oscillospiraceae bacterium]|nr:FAD:protein FMN transferase [Oscillospiraceae bacterium]
MKRIISLILTIAMACTSLTGCSPKYEKFSGAIWEGAFNTVIQVITYQQSQEDFDRFYRTLEEEFIRYHQLYDIYNEYSGMNNICTVNRNAGKQPVKVDKEIIDLLLFSKEWHEKSGGRLNVAMGSVLKVWHDLREEYDRWQDDVLYDYGDPDACPVQLPDMALLQEKAQHTDIDCVEIDTENMTVFITDENVQLDVGGIAKGYATECIADLLAEKYDNFIISAGGNVRCHGRPKDGRRRWGVGIENPAVDENWQMIGGNIDMAYYNTDMSLVCSGGYQRYMVIDGQRYHHIIDPSTLYPEEVYLGVSILCEDSGMADALSTTLFLMQPAEAMAFVEAMDGVDCILVETDGTTHISSGASAYLGSRGVTNRTK